MRSIKRLRVLLAAGVATSALVCPPAQAAAGDTSGSSAQRGDPVNIAARGRD